jgi:hypothetical protein
MTDDQITRQQQWRRRFPVKYAAHIAVWVALRKGKLTRQPCEVCGSDRNIDAHHDRYDRPLQVRWLCRKHHVLLHRRAAP